jgi:hypothetical protein
VGDPQRVADGKETSLPDSAERPRAEYVYRRIHPYNWDARRSKLKRGAFIPRANTQLSVFRADLRTPRGLLQQCIDDWRQKLTSDDESTQHSAAENLRHYGETPEQLVQNGWRIAELPVTALTERGFTLDGPEADGHQNVAGDYPLYSGELIRIARILDEVECLGNPQV